MSERTSITKYSKEELKQLHFELWDWLVNNPINSRHSWPKWKELPNATAYCHCFACVIAKNTSGNDGNNRKCRSCPLKVPDNKLTKNVSKQFICDKKNGLFSLWYECFWRDKNYRLATKYAKIIRDSWK